MNLLPSSAKSVWSSCPSLLSMTIPIFSLCARSWFWEVAGEPLSKYHFGSSSERPLAEKLLNDPLYRKQYTAHLRTIINESLDTNLIRNKINQLQSLAHNAADSDPWKGFSMSQYYSNVESAIWTGWGFGGIMSTIDERKQYLLSHPEISLLPPIISNVNVNNNLVEVVVSNASSVELMITSSQYNSKFQAFTMNDDGINGDLIANDGIYSIYMPFSGNINVKFYIYCYEYYALKF